MAELSLHADGLAHEKEEDLEAQRNHEISALEKERERNIYLFTKGYIHEDKLNCELEHIEREILVWKSRTTERHKIAMQLQICASAMPPSPPPRRQRKLRRDQSL